MANRENLPIIQSSLNDQTLNTQQTPDLGRRVILIGTAARGPMLEPRQVTSIDAAEELFGDLSEGTLVRAFSECLLAPGGVKDILLVRMGNGNRASLDVPEATGSGLAQESQNDDGDAWPALTLTAKDPGEIYNEASIRQEVVDGQLSVVFFNPVTELETVVPYDPLGLVDNSVSDVQELADALNADSNFSSACDAVVNTLTTSMTISISSTDSYVTFTGNAAHPSGTVDVDLAALLVAADTDDDDITEDTSIVTVDTPVTAGNKLVSILQAYSLVDQVVDLDAHGKTQVTLADPVQTSGGVAIDFLKQDLTVDGTNDGRAIHVVTNAFVGTGDDEKVLFEFQAFEAIDTDTLVVKRTGPSGQAVEVDSSDYTVTSVGGEANAYTASITLDTPLPEGHVLTVTYDSEEFALTKVTTLTALKAATSYRVYFAAGTRLYFGSAQPADIRVAYKAKKMFTENRDIQIIDAENGVISFINLSRLPDVTAGADVFLELEYLPEWPSLTSARSLSGGSNGITMTGAEKYEALADAYEALENTPRAVTVPVATYIDDTKVDYDPETGVQVEVNAGYAEQLAAACEDLLDGVSETYGVIAVKPIEPANGRSIQASDITDWIDRLVNFDFGDTTRAANVMKNMDSKHLRVVAFEPIFANSRVRQPYTTSGESVYAGLKAKLPSNKAATNKPLTNIVGLRFELSTRQLNELAGARYIVANTDAGVPVVTSDVTAAAKNSQWRRSMTFDIVVEAMDGVRRVMKPFLGNGFGPAERNAADTAIRSFLASMADAANQKLVDFDHVITVTPSQSNNNTGRVRLILQPVDELVKFIVDVDLRKT